MGLMGHRSDKGKADLWLRVADGSGYGAGVTGWGRGENTEVRGIETG